MEPHDANGLEPRIRGHDQVSAEAAEKFIGKGQYAPLTQPLSCEAVGGRPHHQRGRRWLTWTLGGSGTSHGEQRRYKHTSQARRSSPSSRCRNRLSDRRHQPRPCQRLLQLSAQEGGSSLPGHAERITLKYRCHSIFSWQWVANVASVCARSCNRIIKCLPG